MAGEASSALLRVPLAPSPMIGFTRAQFATWRAGAARVRGGTGRAKVIFIGDSTTWGENGGNSVGLRDGAHNNAYPAIISAYFNSNGLPSAQDNVMASGGLTQASTVIADFRNSYKPGLNIASPWIIDTGVSTLAGRCFSVTSADATGFVYTPEVPVDSFEIGDLNASGAGVYTWQVDGGATTQVTETNATPLLTKQSISAGARGTHTLTIKRVSGTAFIRHVKGWDSTTAQVDVLNAGRGAAATGDIIVNTAPYGPLGATTDEASNADLVVCNMGINDILAGTIQATFKSNYQTLINACIAGGASMLLVVPHQTDTAVDLAASQANIRQWILDLGVTNSLPVYDFQTVLGPFAAMNSIFNMFGARHCRKSGYALEGTDLGPVLTFWSQ